MAELDQKVLVEMPGFKWETSLYSIVCAEGSVDNGPILNKHLKVFEE